MGWSLSVLSNRSQPESSEIESILREGFPAELAWSEDLSKVMDAATRAIQRGLLYGKLADSVIYPLAYGPAFPRAKLDDIIGYREEVDSLRDSSVRDSARVSSLGALVSTNPQ